MGKLFGVKDIDPSSIFGDALQFGAAIYGYNMQKEENEEQRQWASRENTISRAENYRYNEMSAINADLRQRAQYHDLYSPSAQVEEIKKAGLSPALMYGGTPSAGGVATGQQGGGANGIGPTMPAIFSATQAAIQAANMVANTNLQQAQADKLRAEIPNIKEQNNSIKLANDIQEITKTKLQNELQLSQVRTDLLSMFIKVEDEDGEIQQQKSVFEVAKNSNTFDDFMNNLRTSLTNAGMGEQLLMVSTEEGQKVLRSIFTAAKDFDRELGTIELQKGQVKLQNAIYKYLNKSNFAEMSSEQMKTSLNAALEEAKIDERKRKAINKVLDKLEEKTSIADYVICLGLLVDHTASNYKLPINIQGDKNYTIYK